MRNFEKKLFHTEWAGENNTNVRLRFKIVEIYSSRVKHYKVQTPILEKQQHMNRDKTKSLIYIMQTYKI